MAKNNVFFDKEGNLYLREKGGKCKDCELPKEYCIRVKCISNNDRFMWKQHNEVYTEFLKSKGLIKNEEVLEQEKP